MEETVLPVAYRDVLEVLADAGKPLRTRQIAAALGWASSAAVWRGCA